MLSLDDIYKYYVQNDYFKIIDEEGNIMRYVGTALCDAILQFLRSF